MMISIDVIFGTENPAATKVIKIFAFIVLTPGRIPYTLQFNIPRFRRQIPPIFAIEIHLSFHSDQNGVCSMLCIV